MKRETQVKLAALFIILYIVFVAWMVTTPTMLIVNPIGQ